MLNKFLITYLAVIGLLNADDNTTSANPPATTERVVTSTQSPTTTPGVPYVPSVEPQTNLYTLKHTDGGYCIMLKAAIRLAFQFRSFTDKKILTSVIDIPPAGNGTLVDGNCNPTSVVQSMSLKFFNNWMLEFTFKMNSTIKQYYLDNVNVTYDIKHNVQPFPQAENLGLRVNPVTMNDDWVKQLGSYMCYSRRVFIPSNSSSSSADGLGLTNLTVTNEQYQAFVNLSEPVFSQAVKRCDQDAISNLIPIVVGAALGALIVIVLVAYFIGRRHKRGYEAV